MKGHIKSLLCLKTNFINSFIFMKTFVVDLNSKQYRTLRCRALFWLAYYVFSHYRYLNLYIISKIIHTTFIFPFFFRVYLNVNVKIAKSSQTKF